MYISFFVHADFGGQGESKDMGNAVRGQTTKRESVTGCIGEKVDEMCDKTSSVVHRLVIWQVCKESEAKCAQVINWQRILKRTVHASDRHNWLPVAVPEPGTRTL